MRKLSVFKLMHAAIWLHTCVRVCVSASGNKVRITYESRIFHANQHYLHLSNSDGLSIEYELTINYPSLLLLLNINQCMNY